jgi:2-oxoglutarate ferredoxin oxidoreductase subunit beta
MCEILSQMDGAAYIVRRSLHDVVNVRRAKKAIRQAFEVQEQGLGFAMVELLSSCPTNWGMGPEEALKWVEEHMVPVYPLGDFTIHDAIQKKGG